MLVFSTLLSVTWPQSISHRKKFHAADLGCFSCTAVKLKDNLTSFFSHILKGNFRKDCDMIIRVSSFLLFRKPRAPLSGSESVSVFGAGRWSGAQAMTPQRHHPFSEDCLSDVPDGVNVDGALLPVSWLRHRYPVCQGIPSLWQHRVDPTFYDRTWQLWDSFIVVAK